MIAPGLNRFVITDRVKVTVGEVRVRRTRHPHPQQMYACS
jgi:hypothetical protein